MPRMGAIVLSAATIARAMKVICGLGNPGERYRLTRHNVGFRVVDLLADRWALTGQGRVKDGAAVLEHRLPEPAGRVLLVKPLKYMNLSGGPLSAAMRQTDADPASDLLVIADDVDLLSVLLHELGHELGLGHTESGLMAGLISLGERRLPTAEELDELLHHMA